MSNRLTGSLIALCGVLAASACAQDSPTAPQAALPQTALNARPAPPAAQTLPSGEHIVGKVAIEPAYDAESGELMYLLTPEKATFPSKANAHARSPLYLVEYPAGSTVGTLNCMGVPGNCPDHDLDVATAATQIMPSVYGTDPYALPGHDHLADSQGAEDWNVAWEVIEVLFTNSAAANTHLTTEAEIQQAVANHDAITVDLGIAFNCSVVPESLYLKGTPVL